MVKRTKIDDYILQLPVEILHHILSCLPLRDLVRTSILSKRWEKIWIMACTVLRFDYKFFGGFDFYTNETKINAKRKELMEFAERTLHSCYMQKVSINNLELSLPFYNSKTATFLDRCIRHAIGCNVRELKIGFIYEGFYNLPKTVFAAKSITELRLHGCSLESSSCSNINMPSLKTLRLSDVCLGDHTIQNLLANFPVIEKFTIRGECSTSKGTLKFFSLVNPKLVMVEIQYCDFERVEIEATGLQSFSLRSSSLVHPRGTFFSTPCELNISACKNMTTLELQHCNTISEKMMNYNLSKLCVLETLKISHCSYWETITISNCRLKELVVHHCKELVKLEIDGPNLTSFSYYGSNVISFSSNGSALSRADISIYPIDDRHVDNAWYVKLTEFLGKLNNSKVLKLHSSTSYKNVIFPKEFREFLVPPLYNVEHLILASNRKLSSEAVEEIVDGFLWFSLHPVTLSIPFESFMGSKKGTLGFKFLYNKEINNDGNFCHCSSLPIKCWRHSLAEIKIEWAKGVDDEDKKKIQSVLDKKPVKKIGGVTN